jgi:uncharacterized protein YjbI with pentapeptide repeats
MSQQVPDRTRRVNAWWEPTYAPELLTQLSQGNWALPDNAAHQRLFVPDNFQAQVGQRATRGHFSETRFTSCDFSGRFDQYAMGASFTECDFENCDFGTTTWAKVKFRKCTFRRCSFSQSTWKESEFRNCTWESIGFSGNETVLISVYVSNPAKFIAAGYTNSDSDILAQKNTTPEFQIARLEETKATVARNIFNNHKTVGDDAAFYLSFSAYVRQYGRSVASSAAQEFRVNKGRKRVKAAFKFLYAKLEGWVNVTFGVLTNWGSSALRPLLCLAATFVVFSAIYRLTYFDSLDKSLSMSFDVTTIAAYTRSVTQEVVGGLYLIASLNLLMAILFYSAFFSVAISKISRTR